MWSMKENVVPRQGGLLQSVNQIDKHRREDVPSTRYLHITSDFPQASNSNKRGLVVEIFWFSQAETVKRQLQEMLTQWLSRTEICCWRFVRKQTSDSIVQMTRLWSFVLRFDESKSPRNQVGTFER